MSALQQAELHLTVARGLAAAYVLYMKATGASTDRFDKDLVRPSRLIHSEG